MPDESGLSEEIAAGTPCTVTRDITIGGELAFEEGETVTVEKVDPNPAKPDYRYVVRSRLLGSLYQLREKDLVPAVETAPDDDEVGEGTEEAGRRELGWLRRHRKAVTVCVALALLAGAAVVVVLLLKGGKSPSETLSEKATELRKVVEEAGSSSTSLSVEIQNASRKAPTAEEFTPLGKEIARKYVAAFQGYYKRIKAIREELQAVEAAPEVKAVRANLVKASDSYERAMLEYVTALDQIGKGQINEAFATFQDIQKLINQGNALLQ